MLPSTCGLRVADRRDLIVAVYSSLLGTGASFTVTVCTGNACMAGAAGAAADLPQPIHVKSIMASTDVLAKTVLLSNKSLFKSNTLTGWNYQRAAASRYSTARNGSLFS